MNYPTNRVFEHFDDSMLFHFHFRNIRKCLITFLKASAKKTESSIDRNPSWIMCLPIVHFLGGSLHPFEELDYAKFDDKTKEWWLVRDFEQEKEELKTHKWSR